MFKLDDHRIDIRCPSCDFSNTVRLKQVRVRDVVICRGCKANIRLQDHLSTTKRAIRAFRRAMMELEEQLARISKIRIRL